MLDRNDRIDVGARLGCCQKGRYDEVISPGTRHRASCASNGVLAACGALSADLRSSVNDRAPAPAVATSPAAAEMAPLVAIPVRQAPPTDRPLVDAIQRAIADYGIAAAALMLMIAYGAITDDDPPRPRPCPSPAGDPIVLS